MKYNKIKLLCWNVRGLGDESKCNVVRNVIKDSRCDLLCIQETKLNEKNLSYVLRALPSFFQRQVVSVDARGSAGGIVIAWKHSYELVSSWATPHTCTAILKQVSTGQEMAITNVYGPSIEGHKSQFIEELRGIHSKIVNPWMLVGDFNLVRWYVDRPSDLRGFGLMCEFNDLIRQFEVLDVELKNRAYTWSSKRPSPSFSRIDRIFLSTHWNLNFPIIELRALETIVSDHVPLLLSCRGTDTRPTQFKFENFWLQLPQAHQLVHSVWTAQGDGDGLPQQFNLKTELMHRQLRN